MSSRLAAWAALLILMHGCATEPGPAQLMQPGLQAAANREVQSRRFDDVSEAELLAACVSVLQDQGFRITTSEARLGVIAGRKPRADEEIIGDAFRQALLAGITLGLHPDLKRNPPDSFGVVVATRGLSGPRQSHEVRVTFFLAWGILGSQAPERVSGAEAITSPALYQQFFGMLGTTLARSRAGS